ncbi:MAG: CheR family methyltransferase, partial [Myxococcota bacterium]
VVGIGASAGGLNPILRVVEQLGPSIPAALVIVQHLSPDHPSLMPELLSRRTSLSVELARDGVQIRAGCCYLMPPGAEVRLRDGRLWVLAGAQGERHALPIDTLFQSVAQARGRRAVGVVLSGTGSDGTAGAAAIRQAGGTVIAQQPTEAQFNGMPLAVVDRGLADYVTPAGEIPSLIERLLDGHDVLDDEYEPWMHEVFAIVKERVGLDLSEYKASTFFRRLTRRMQEVAITQASAYLDRLTRDEDEVRRLLESLLIDVTAFFRDSAAFETLASEVLPPLIKQAHEDQRELRVWSAGCARGHEAYSLAMLIEEISSAQQIVPRYKLFATDANDDALDIASAGYYGPHEVHELTPARLERHFRPDGDGFRIREAIRRHIVFAKHNLQRDPPFTQVDLLLCRNVLIYFRPQLQNRLLSLFHFALRPGGFLFLGNSESIGEFSSSFAVVGGVRDRIYRRGSERPVVPHLPPMRPQMAPAHPVRRERRHMVEAALRALTRRFAPAAALCDATGQVVHLFGDLSPFLELPRGTVDFRLDNLARGPLAAVIATVIAQAQRRKAEVSYSGVTVPLVESPVQVTVVPLADQDTYLVAFDLEVKRIPRPTGELPEQARMEDLHQELLFTRESLQATIEELQTANEELQASNEEMLAANEELQATNEELHATNEELHTVSSEREERIDELVRLNEDMENLLTGTKIATIFLDERHRIRRFSGPIHPYIRLLPQDIGRSVSDIAHFLVDVDLEETAGEVLETQRPQSFETAARDCSVLVRAIPYRSAIENVRGTVFTFVDVTALRRARAMLRAVLDSVPQHIALLDEAGEILLVNEAWRRFGSEQGAPQSQVGVNYLEASSSDPSAKPVVEGIRAVIDGAQDVYSVEYPCDTASGPHRFVMHATPLRALPPFEGRGAVVSHFDITSRSLLEEKLTKSEDRYRHLFVATRAPFMVVQTEDLRIVDANPAIGSLLRRQTDAMIGSSIKVLVSEDRIGLWARTFRDVLERDTPTVRMLELIDGDGRDHSLSATLSALPRIDGTRDVLVELRDAEFNQEADAPAEESTTARHSHRLEALGNLAGGVAHEVNNVLAGVLGLVEHWTDDAAVDHQLRSDLREVVAACHRGRDVTRNLLGFARADTITGVVSMPTVVEEIATLARRAAGPDIEVAVNIEGEGLEVEGDRSQLGQALLNLCLNGLDAMRGKGGTLEIRLQHHSTDESRQELALSVRDEGKGMTTSIQARAFEPFFTTKPRDKGTGLGLPMVYGLVRGLGGFIDVVSAPDEGTLITLILPRARQRAQRPGGVASPPDESERDSIEKLLEGKALLVVDDDSLVRRGIARMLRRSGAEVVEARDGFEALERIAERTFELIVLDVVMPGMDGTEVLAKLRHDHANTPVLLCSGYPERGEQAPHLDAHSAFVYKPVSALELETAVTKLLRS